MTQQKPKQCPFCGHYYLEPCDEERQKKCLNIKLKDRKPEDS